MGAHISSYRIAFGFNCWFFSKVIDIEGRNVGMRLVGLKQITPASGNAWKRTAFADECRVWRVKRSDLEQKGSHVWSLTWCALQSTVSVVTTLGWILYMFYSLALGFQLCNAGKRGLTFVLVYFRFVLAALCLLGISRLVRRFFFKVSLWWPQGNFKRPLGGIWETVLHW